VSIHEGVAVQSEGSERTTFETATVPSTVTRVGPHQQDSARRLVSVGWIGYGEHEDLIEAVARPRKARDGGRLFGAVVREKVPA
jgi:hypothetical protein